MYEYPSGLFQAEIYCPVYEVKGTCNLSNNYQRPAIFIKLNSQSEDAKCTNILKKKSVFNYPKRLNHSSGLNFHLDSSVKGDADMEVTSCENSGTGVRAEKCSVILSELLMAFSEIYKRK